MRSDTIDYELKDALEVLENLKTNPYGIKDTHHSINRSKDRSINLELIYKKLYLEKPVAIEKEENTSSRFLVTYTYTKSKDLAIGIDILKENELQIITVIDKSVNRRKHHGN